MSYTALAARRNAALHFLALFVLLVTVAPPPVVRAEVAAASVGGVPSASALDLPLDRTRYRITLKQPGLYSLNHSDLADAGVPLDGVDPRNFHLYREAEEVAFELTGAEDGRFDAGDLLRFYAPPLQNLLTDVSTFWLAVGDAPAALMTTRSVTPGEQPPATTFVEAGRFEINRTYRSNIPMLSDVDHWYWSQTSKIGASGTLTVHVPFTVEHPLTTGTARINIELWGASSDARVNPDHRIRLFVNNTPAGVLQWDGAVATVGQITFDQSLLQHGQNRLTLYMPGDTGAMDSSNRLWEVNWLNWFDLAYARSAVAAGNRLMITPPPGWGEFESNGWTSPDLLLYDVTDPLHPVRLEGAAIGGAAPSYTLRFRDDAPTGATYAALAASAVRAPLAVAADAPSHLHTPATGADYVVITHSAFAAGIQPLADFRQAQGHSVRVVDVQDIYDEFSGGLLSYHAIRDFLDFAFHAWPPPAPAYVLLVGDGTYDFMNREGYGAKTFIPPFLAAVDPLVGETAADNRFVAVHGADIMPDMHLGRLPVNNTAELAAMVDKLIAYEAAPLPGDWRTRAVFVTDNADAAGNFPALSDNSVGHVPPGWTTPKIYLGTAEYPQNQAAQAQTAVLAAFNAGALLFNYVGHASVTAWAAEMLLSTNSLGGIANGSAFPILLPMTCLEGSYHNPRFAGLSESLVRLSNRGALASWAPTGLGVASGHDYLHQGFMDALFTQDVYRLGAAADAGKLNLYENARFSDGTPRFRDLIDTYVLLGDPASQIGVPRTIDLELFAAISPGPHEPGATITYTLNYRNAGAARARNIEIVAALPPWLTGLSWSASGPALTHVVGTQFTWTLDQLAAGEGGIVTITGRIDPAAPAGAFPMAAQFSITGSGEENDLTDNAFGPVYINLAAADVSLTQSVTPHILGPGEQITITLAYKNYGPGAATGLRIDAPLPFLLEQLVVSSTGPAVTVRGGSQYTLDVAPLPPFATGSVTLVGRVPFGVISQQVNLQIAAKARLGLPDPNPENNVGGLDVVTIYGADLYEPDDVSFQAQRPTLPVREQSHLYEPMGDEDWVVFSAAQGVTYLIHTLTPDSELGMVLYLRDASGAFLDSSDGLRGDGISELRWTAPAAGDYYVTIAGGGLTAGARYSLTILAEDSQEVFLPLITGAR